jgi:activator of HSP90 ATPase
LNIHQEISIAATPAAVYALLLSSEDFAKMTGGRSAKIAKEVGGEISMFGGDISGRNVELAPGKRLVQAWRSKAWPEGVYSIVRFELVPEGKGTKLVFDQAGHPEEAQAMLESGWAQMYWQPMNALLSGKAIPQMKGM